MRKLLSLLFLCLCCAAGVRAQLPLDSVEARLRQAPVQEKVYLHLDNTCYFKGDTIWYKAYVVRADDLTYTDMSRILYVELVSPDGMVVERHNVIVSGQGYSDGSFALQDSIYSGFYELRAYTRWMLNFCVSEHPYTRKDYEAFYNRQMARDFFRQFDAVYSRVIPVYERPETPGDYGAKYIVSRPKTRLEKEEKERLTATFYPEGGHLIAGRRCRVAFELQNEEGELQDLTGQLEIPGQSAAVTIQTTHRGRGCFEVTVPESGRLKARFSYRDKTYDFDLPRTEKAGCALRVEAAGDSLLADVALVGLPDADYGVAVLCRGVLRHFQKVSGSARVAIDGAQLPTGVNNLLVIDAAGRPLADRLFFVNHHDYGLQPITVSEPRDTYEPFAPIRLDFQAPADAGHISIAVRDGATDEPTFDTGNMLTDLLLSSELKGFIAYPDYYFEADDAEHRQALDLLMMVQGWRRYDYQELTAEQPLRYQPEQTMTVEGAVYPTGDADDFEESELRYWAWGVFGHDRYEYGELEPESFYQTEYRKLIDRVNGGKIANDGEAEKLKIDAVSSGNEAASQEEGSAEPFYAKTALGQDKGENYGIDRGGLNYEVTVEAELVFEDDIATVALETDNGGHFAFNVPPYYGEAILFLKAYKTDISDKRRKRIDTKGILDETAWPEFYVKRDLFYPVFARKYSFYQCHLPDEQNGMGVDDGTLMPEIERISKMDTQLRNVNVQGRRRRGRHAIDYSKPACVYDAHELYNLVTDRGLSFGRYDASMFPFQVSMALLGNYNSNRQMQVMARLNDGMTTPYVFYRNFKPGLTVMMHPQFVSDRVIQRDIKLNRQDEIRLYTDFELRNDDKRVEQQSEAADVTLDFMLVADEGKRYTFRDRRMILKGMTEPADFYHPDYSRQPLPGTVADYRRTLYWNPNAQLDGEGRFTATFYNTGKQTRIKVSAAGLTAAGQPLTTKQ